METTKGNLFLLEMGKKMDHTLFPCSNVGYIVTREGQAINISYLPQRWVKDTIFRISTTKQENCASFPTTALPQKKACLRDEH